MLTRREILHAAGLSILAIHAPLMAKTPSLDLRPTLVGPPRARLRRLKLWAANLEATRDFYRERFGWNVREVDDDRFDLLAGPTTMEFHRAAEGEAPYYHFAFNISRNKFRLAKAWLAERTELVHSPDGRDQFHFSSRDADAVYFLDPAGNLGELIAHSRLDNERPGPFGPGDVHDTCEIGIVSPDVLETVRWLGAELGAKPYKDPIETFAAVGDERGFFIVVRADRLWFPRQKRPAVDCQAEVWIEGEAGHTWRVPHTGCSIRTEENI